MLSIFPERAARRACLILAAMAATLAVLGSWPAAADDAIVVDADKSLGAPRLRHGFLHGITYQPGRDYSNTVALVTALKPKTWRLGNLPARVYNFVVDEAKLPHAVGTEVVFVLQEAFIVRYGFNVKVGPGCPPRRRGCFPSYDAFKEAWAGVVHDVMKGIAKRKAVVHWFEVFAEPTSGATTKLAGLGPDQLTETFKISHDIVRQYRPDAKIVAPSLGGYSVRILKFFLTFVVDNNLRLDAVNWHEFDSPDLVVPHVNEIREFVKTQPKLCKPTCPEIHIGEYAPSEQSFIPGYGVGWLYHLERSGVDQANRACWDLPGGGDTCWASFNGMLSQDNATPQSLYWVYKAYADLHATRIATESSQPRTVALASKDETRNEIRILAGKYGQNTAPARTVIQVKGFPGNAASVNAEIRRIPDNANRLQSMPAAPAAQTRVIAVRDKGFSVVIDDFRNGEAYIIVVRPAG